MSCPNCIDWIDSRIGSSKYDGYCATCFKRIFPEDPRSIIVHSSSKEIRVRNAISQHFQGFIHNTPIYTENCDCTHRRRIDHRKLIGNTILAIETDEFSHMHYNQHDEEIRYDDLYMIHSGKWIFIRFNPDKTEKNQTDLEDRIYTLIKEIERQILRIEREENIELVEIIKLFYNETSNEDKDMFVLECEYCKKNFSSKTNLNVHKKTAKFCLQLQGKNGKTYVCDLCDKFFTTNQNLQEHICKRDTIKYKDKLKEYEILLKERDNQIKELKEMLEKANDTISEIAKNKI